MSRRRKANQKKITTSLDGITVHAPNARTRLPDVFKVFDEMIATVNSAIKTTTPSPGFEMFQFGTFHRGFNSLKAAKTLLENGHWEGATGIARQLMELVLNMEYIFVCSENPEQEALRFTRYGALQQYLRIVARSKYLESIGESSSIRVIDLTFDPTVTFAEFRRRRRDGYEYWVSSFCAKSAKELAKNSPNPFRVHQYEVLYRSWSEQIHCSPGALMTSIFPSEEADWFLKMLYLDDKETAETAGNLVNIFCELWSILPLTRPTIDAELSGNWIARVQVAQIGAWLDSESTTK